MTTLPNTQHLSGVERYLRHGWSLVPIPPGTKGPAHKGWQKRENSLTSHEYLPEGYGVGLLHAYSGTMALDVDMWDRAAGELAINGIDLQGLYDAPDAVVIESGRQGHGKLLYAMPFGLSLPSKKLTTPGPDGKPLNYLDFRCGTAEGLTVQDVLPPSIHPDTRRPYQWAGAGDWTRLPQIPDSLMQFWLSRLASDRAEPRETVDAPPGETDWDHIRSALGFIDPDCSREDWVTVGMALHFAGRQSNQEAYSMQVWDEWSQQGTKYKGSRDIDVQWRSFRSDKATKVKLGSLFRLAAKGGWTRPIPNIAQLFASVDGTTTAPAEMSYDLRPAPPGLDLNLVPEVLRRRATEAGRVIGCDPLVPLFAGLAAVSGAVDARTRLEIRPGFKVPPVLWVMTIGEPADKKTPGSDPMFNVFDRIEAEDRPRYRQALQQYEGLLARHEAAKKAFLDAAKDVTNLLSGEMPEGYGEAPSEPKPLKIVVQDITSQMLVRRCADQPRGVLCKLDEMTSWTKKVTDPRSGEARSAWTQAYESKRYEMDRVGAGTINAENYAVTMYGNIQPDVFAEMVKPMSEDGLLQRFIPIVLRGDLVHKGKAILESETNVAQYEQMLRVVFGLPAMTYGLSPEALAVFDEFQNWYSRQRDDERLLRSGPIFMTAFGKLEGLLGRLALLWHVMENPYAINVSGDTMRRCVDVVRSFIVPSIRYAFDGELGGVSSFDQWMADYIIQHADFTEISMNEIKRASHRNLGSMNQWLVNEKIVTSMQPLEKHRWVARIDDGAENARGRERWAINPALKDIFADRRRSVIEAKQRRMDQTYQLSTKGVPTVHGFEGTSEEGDSDD